MTVIKSVYDNQDDIINGIIQLHCPDGIECDVTYGNGMFYKNLSEPKYKFDIDPQCDGVIQASSNDLPLEDNSINSIMFDPPFLTYIKAGREGNGSMIMSNRFAGYRREVVALFPHLLRFVVGANLLPTGKLPPVRLARAVGVCAGLRGCCHATCT
mgnify:CR=1 FL=1